MTVEDAEDRRGFVSADDFGELVTFTPPAAAAFQAAAIFDEAFSPVDVEGVEIGETSPMLTVTADDVPGIDSEWTATVRGVVYLVHRPMPQDDGRMLLVGLRET